MPGTSTENEDSVLVEAVLKGDKDAFRLLVRKHERLVVSIVFRIITQKEDAEDLCQDIFLKVYEKLSTFNFQSRLSTWIGSITFNMCVNAIKKKKNILLDDLTAYIVTDEADNEKPHLSISDSSWKPDQQLLNKERDELLHHLIERLPIIQKTILNLFHYHELSLLEIADITQLPVNTVKSHLFRGRKHLKEEMSKY